MTTIAGRTGIGISTHSLVIIRHLRWIVMFMAIYTTEYVVIIRCGMAFITLVPLAFVTSTVNREIQLIVVPGGRCPGRLGMASLASCGELGRQVIWIICPVIFRCVAPKTGIRSAVVIPVVTGRTIISNRGMCTN